MTPTHVLSEEDEMLLGAYLDGELDAQTSLALERRLATEPPMRAHYENLAALRMSLQADRTAAPRALRERVSTIPTAHPITNRMKRPKAVSFDVRQMAAGVALAAMLGSSATYLALRSGPNDQAITAAVAGHQRALLAAAPFDIASSDRHTVTPWFNAKLALSPSVPDLTPAGYPLVGGRIDLIAAKAVPTIVYKRREHVISVVAMPRAGSRDHGTAPSQGTRDGYWVVEWRGRDFMYTAISDIGVNELDDFVKQWRVQAEATLK